MNTLSSADVRKLLHNKYVAVLGDSIQRSVTKDPVKILQNDEFRTEKQLKGKVHHYRTDHHPVRFYFLTRVSSEYIESVLANFQHGPQPDVIINSCGEVLSPKCLVIYNMSMSVGFKAGEVLEYPIPNVRWDIIEVNFYTATLAYLHQLDVIDMHFHLRFELRSRVKDATHSNQLAHRKYTCILMAHID
uniref:Protein kinase domain-containing protein n=1 Tax=Pyxicephalus adspersus TaxID=30357 RepID=A0AAV3AE33_PYXAD|nr:TPA: hypothetical protein GDO54_013456 [Pyxicephalus adspersus]